MAIWDTIIDGISDLGTDIFGNSNSGSYDFSDVGGSSASSGLNFNTPDTSNLNTGSTTPGQSAGGTGMVGQLGNLALKSLGSLSNAEQVKASKEDALYRFLQVDSRMMPTNMIGKFAPTKTGFDTRNYSASAEDINAQWNHTLQGFVSSNLDPQSQVSKYQQGA